MSVSRGAARQHVGPTVPIEVTVGADAEDGITLLVTDARGEGLEAVLTAEQAADLARHLLSLSESRNTANVAIKRESSA